MRGQKRKCRYETIVRCRIERAAKQRKNKIKGSKRKKFFYSYIKKVDSKNISFFLKKKKLANIVLFLSKSPQSIIPWKTWIFLAYVFKTYNLIYTIIIGNNSSLTSTKSNPTL